MPLSEAPPPADGGNEPPFVRGAVPGPMSRALTRRLEKVESPAFSARRSAREAASGADLGPIVYASALGSNVVDVDGNRFVDFVAGFGAALLGHGDRRPARALEAQGERLWHALGDVYASDSKVALLERLAALHPEKNARVILGQSGADAITAAMKTALLATKKPGVIAFRGAYHGLSYAPLAALDFQPNYRDPFAAQLSPHVRFCPFADSTAVLDRALAAVRAELARGDVGLVLLEPILGRGGCVPAAPGFLAALADLAKAHDAIFAVDEIWTGLGRSGAMLASVADGAVADLICLGKGLGGGLPMAACVGREAVMAAWGESTAVHTSTFLGAPLACATAVALLDAITRDHLAERARLVGDRFRARLIAEAPNAIVRGRGLMIGVQLASATQAFSAMRALLERGYLVLTGGIGQDTLTLTPPLTIDEARLDDFAVALGDVVRGLA